MSRTILHKHHIIPKHAGGTDDPSNLIYLTVEEHAEAHKLLFEQYGRWQDELAWKGLSGQIGKEEIILKTLQRNLGKTFSEETRSKMRESSKGKNKNKIPWNKGKVGFVKHTQETLDKISRSSKQRIVSEETKKKISDNKKHYWKEKKIKDSQTTLKS
jgi:hypothetical protein